MTQSTMAAPTLAPVGPTPSGFSSTSARVRAITEELSDQFYERSEVIRALMVALLAAKHSLVLGPPGTAKSELARALTGRITGATYWEILLSKFSDPKKMFGPVDVAALMQGTYTQIFDGRATKADIAFMDEIFKCSTGALNETLALLNERLYHPESGGAPIRCPLIGAITASNELPEDAESAAIYDRLLVRLEVNYLTDPSNFARLIRSVQVPVTAPPTTVDLVDLRAAVSTYVPAIGVPEAVIDAVCQLRATLRRAELIASDRRWKAAMRLLQASAFLAGRPEVTANDLAVLSHVLWDAPAQRVTVEREVLQLINPDARAALDLLDAINGLEQELESKAGQSAEALAEWGMKEAHKNLAAAMKELDRMRANTVRASRPTDTVDQVIARCKAVHGRVMQEALSMPAGGL
ncbi:AAA family ATPase [Nonomuraea maheshkhaliensis]|uniref:AAA family ATPase n=1 Tax=Nonomuraea maheshkhaliensis TaxID=419590 RepID=A0ABP4QLX7_9ACTN